MRQLYEEVEKQINRIEFNALWEGFHPYSFALYNNETIWLAKEEIPYQKEFCANTCIRYKEELLAIWKIADQKDLLDSEKLDVIQNNKTDNTKMKQRIKIEELAVKIATGIIHEMFHCYQEELGESRYPDDIKLLSYPMEERNLKVKLKENQLLVATLRANDLNERKDLLTCFKICRQYREELIGIDILEEYRVETIEGAAEYVSLLALKELWGELLFREKLEGYLKVLDECTVNLLDIRRISYLSGAILLLVLSLTEIPLTRVIGKTKKTYWELAALHFNTITREACMKMVNNSLMCVEGGCWGQQEYKTYQQKDLKVERLIKLKDSNLCDVRQLILEYKEKQKKQLQLFFLENKEEIQVDGWISGYDPMNMIKYGNYILCSHFVAITSEDSKKQLVLNGPVVVQLKDDKGREIKGYYK